MSVVARGRSEKIEASAAGLDESDGGERRRVRGEEGWELKVEWTI